MKFTDKKLVLPEGIFEIKTINSETGKIIDSFTDTNVVVIDAKEAIIKSISVADGAGVIDDIKLGDDTGSATMTGSPSITFSDAGANDTIVRDSGDFLADGFITQMSITVSGAVSNNGSFTIQTVTTTTITTTAADTLTNEGPIGGVSINGVGSPNNPVTAVDTYDATTMNIIFDSSYVLTVGYPNATSVTFSTTILGVDVMALYPSETSKIFTSAALHTGNTKVFAYKRYPQKSISKVVDLAISWTIAY